MNNKRKYPKIKAIRKFKRLFNGRIIKSVYVDFENGHTKVYNISHDKDGYEYITLDNPFDKEFGLFTDHIKDAIDCIRNGYGDVVSISNFLWIVDSMSVLYYLDRTIGDEYRAKTIDGFKDAKYAFSIKAYLKYRMFSGQVISNTGKFLDNYYIDSFEDANSLLDKFNALKNLSTEEILDYYYKSDKSDDHTYKGYHKDILSFVSMNKGDVVFEIIQAIK